MVIRARVGWCCHKKKRGRWHKIESTYSLCTQHSLILKILKMSLDFTEVAWPVTFILYRLSSPFHDEVLRIFIQLWGHNLTCLSFSHILEFSYFFSTIFIAIFLTDFPWTLSGWFYSIYKGRQMSAIKGIAISP